MNHQIKNQKGNALLIVLIVIVIMSALILGYLTIITNQHRINTRKIDRIVLKWTVHGMMNKYINELLSYKKLFSDTILEETVNNCQCKIKMEKRDSQNFTLYITAKKKDITYSLSKQMRIKFLSDYLFYSKQDLSVSPVENSYQLYGALCTEKDLIINPPSKGEIMFFIHQDYLIPPITTGNKIVYKNYQTAQIKAGLCDHEKEILNMQYLADKGDINNSIDQKYVKKIKPDFELPSLSSLFTFYQKYAFVYIRDTKKYSTKKIINQYLLEKDVIGMGNGENTTFKLPKKDRSTRHLYFKKTDSLEAVLKVIPYQDQDTFNTAKHHVIKKDQLILDSEEKKYGLTLPDKLLKRKDTFPYLREEIIYVPKDRAIKDVYLDDRLLYEGNDYEINHQTHSIYFYSPEFTHLLGTGNGQKKEFTLPEKYTFLIVFKNQYRTTDFILKEKKLVFNSPPAYGEKIYYYKKMPSIYITIKPPAPGVAVCIDQEISCAQINLDQFNCPDKAVIISEIPLYIYGNSNKRIAFICKDDIYLGSIKSDHALSFFGRIIWLDTREQNTIHLENCYLFTEAEKLYCLDYNSKTRKEIKGSITLLGKYRSLSRKDSYIEDFFFHHEENLFNGTFEYADDFQKNPPLAVPFKIEK